MKLQRFPIPLRLLPTVLLLSLQSPAQEKEFGDIHENTTLVYPPARHAPIHKATGMHLYAYMALIGRTDITPSDPRGLAATRLKSTDDPQSPYDDDDLTVYGVNSGQSNIIFNSSMASLDVYEGKGPKQRLKKPRGIACDPDGNVYVADTGHNRIVRLFNPGNYLTFVDAYGKKGEKPGRFKEPKGVALTADGRVLVTDTGNDRIQVFDREMNFLYSLGDRNDSTSISINMAEPDAIAVIDSLDPDNYYRESFMAVADLNNSRIRKISLDGRFMAGVNSTDYGFPEVFITGLAIDYYGNIWATDLFNHCIHKFDRNLRYVTSFGHVGNGESEFFEPRSIAIGKRFGQVFVADKESAQYYHIGTDILKFEITLQDSHPRFDFFLTENSFLSAAIFNENGDYVTTLCRNRPTATGEQTLIWDLMMNPLTFRGKMPYAGTPVFRDSTLVSFASSKAPPGLYRIRLEAKTRYPYNRYFTKKLEVEFAF